MAVYNKFQDFVDQLARGKHDFSSHVLKAAFTNTAPSATNTVLTDITQISAGNGYSAGGVTLDGVTLTETGGTAKVVITDEVFTATGGTVGPFRYVVIYNDTQTSPADPLICWFDYGSSITLNDTETFTIDFDATNGLFTIV